MVPSQVTKESINPSPQSPFLTCVCMCVCLTPNRLQVQVSEVQSADTTTLVAPAAVYECRISIDRSLRWLATRDLPHRKC